MGVPRPASFAGFIDFPPDNRHLVHDPGAFQVGIGVSVLLALFRLDALTVALPGFTAASGLHTLSRAIDRGLGGHDADVPTLALLTLVALYAILANTRRRNP